MPSIIKKATQIVERDKQAGILKKRFKNIDTLIWEKITEILLISLSLIITNYNRMAYTNLSVQLSNNILYMIFREMVNKNIYNSNILFEDWKVNNNYTIIDIARLGDYFIRIFTNEPLAIFE